MLANLGVATTYMAAGYRGLIDIPLVQLIPGSRIAGPARTVQCGQDDNLMVHAAMDAIQPGDVLVITMPDPRPVALVGELLATQAKVHGAAAILVDAAVRDIEALRALGLPIWARWIRVAQASKEQAGAINAPLTIGATTIAAGDVVVLDADGAVAVAAARVPEVTAAAQALHDSEEERRRQYEAGVLSLDVMGLRAKLPIQVRAPHPNEGPRLREIAVSAKAHWGYDRPMVVEWARQGVTVGPSAGREIFVAEALGQPIAWAAVIDRGDVCWLDDLWVEPAWIGSGVGTRLFRHAVDAARRLGATTLEWESEPNAVGFYDRMGGRFVRQSEASEWGRILPVMAIDLREPPGPTA